MLGRLFKARPSHEAAPVARDSFAKEEVVYIRQLQQRAADYAERRVATLRAGGANLDHRPGYADRWEAALQRMLQEGLLREHIEFGGFPQARSYYYTLTPGGERAAAELAERRAGEVA